MELLETFALYNEKLEDIDFSDNQLSRLKGFFRNLNRNWFSKLTRLSLARNQLIMRDLTDFIEIFERDSRVFDRLLFVLRFLHLEGNPLTIHNP
jgi:hypothetical protein